VVSGVGFLVIGPFAAVMTGIGYVNPDVPDLIGFLRGLLWYTLVAIPVVWLASLIFSLILARKKTAAPEAPPAAGYDDAQVLREAALAKAHREKRNRLLNACAASPFVVAGLHLSIWVIAFIVGS
jgi:hypothetical protein